MEEGQRRLRPRHNLDPLGLCPPDEVHKEMTMKHATGGPKEGEGPRADDPLDNQIVESMVGIDDVSLTREAWQ